MRLKVVDELKRPLEGPWLVRIPGWTRERYLSEAPETQFCEYEVDWLFQDPLPRETDCIS